MGLYRSWLRPLLFSADAERVHAVAIRAAELAGSSRQLCEAVAARQAPASERLALAVGGIDFSTPLGLAAGFDKSARAVALLGALGFGHVEVGSISADPSAGNPRPRLFRIPDDGGIVVHYGLPNDGADIVAQRLAGVRRAVPLGINIVSTNRGPGAKPDSDDAVIDNYLRSVRRLRPCADYLCLNLSCPNTRDGRNFFHEPRRLRTLLDALGALGIDRPLFLKVAPFASTRDLETFLETVEPARFVTGFAVNLPSGKPDGLSTSPAELARMPGAVSGRPAAAAADRTIREFYRRMDRERYCIIGSGGVCTGDDAYRKIRLGASLVQLMTVLVYEGPGVVASINERLAQLLDADGFSHVADAVGIDAADARPASSIGGLAPRCAMSAEDEVFMRQAIAASRQALAAGDMPYGAVLVKHGRLLHASGNEQVTSSDCTAHAESVLVRQARERLGPDALLEATVYASGEPCAMCCGVLFLAGVRRVVYAASRAEMARVMGGELLPIESRAVFAGSVPAVAIDGPLLEGEAVAVLEEAAARRGRG